MSRAINKQLFSDATTVTDSSIFNNRNNNNSSALSQEEAVSFFFLSHHMYGGCLTFTAHLLHTLIRNQVFRIAKRFERRKRNFGYGIRYQNVTLEYFDSVKNLFITDMFQHFECLRKLKRKGKEEITIVIHDPGEISKFNEPYLKYWNIITIRKSMQQFLRDRYGIESKFIYHPFYPYLVQQGDRNEEEQAEEKKTLAVSISRIDFYKNTEIILDANERTTNPVKIYGWANSKYVSQRLDAEVFMPKRSIELLIGQCLMFSLTHSKPCSCPSMRAFVPPSLLISSLFLFTY